MNKLIIGCLIFSSLLQSNEINFNQVTEPSQNTIEISFILENVAFIKSYSLESPSRIVLDVFDSKLKSDIDEIYNYPVKKIRASTDKNVTRIVIDLYEYVYWKKPIQTKTDNGILLSLEITKTKKLKTNMRDIIVAIDAGHGGKYPGAVGTNNILEKDVTLLIAKQLERTLKDTEGFSPLMIRAGEEMQQTFLYQFMQMDLDCRLSKVRLFLFGLKKLQVQSQEIYQMLIEKEYKPILKI